ncbi:MAG: D-alanine--D-alanine ligase [Gammaproteobacteria bacterium]|nr:D-alanine--D-alanine ligase [Gammaproteobacteria bacterium]
MNDKENPYKVNDYGKVAVMMGGLSAEREISLESGQAVLAALKRKGVNAHAVDVQHDVMTKLDSGNFDRVFIALHGRGGEDGVIQGALDTLRLPYTGSSVLGSALAMDKCRSKRLWLNHGLPTPAFKELDRCSDWKEVCDDLGLPLMVKPVREGSSFGASKVTRAIDLEQAWQKATEFDQRVMAECWIEGTEYTVPILGESVLPIIRLETPREFYDYQAKYVEETTQYICPCGLGVKREKQLGILAMNAFKALGASGWGRIDLIVDKEDQPWLLEANTIPGMTSHSLVPMAAKQAGMTFDDLVIQILNTSMINKS